MIESKYYMHSSDKTALKALKAVPGFSVLTKAFMKIWSERQYRISNMSSCVRASERQLEKYYSMLPPICEKLGIELPELYLQLDVRPNSYTSGDTNPFIIITSGLLETLPENLIPTVLAHECGHIACHHVLYTTMGNVLLNGSTFTLSNYVPFGSLATIPLEIAFYYWMRCSELSADRAAIICDGSSEKMSEVCLRLAGFDKDIDAIASKEEFLVQAQEYRDMIKSSKWDKTLEFLTLRSMSHPLMTVRALECEEWGNSVHFSKLMDGTYLEENIEEESPASEKLVENGTEETPLPKSKPRIDLRKLLKKSQDTELQNGAENNQIAISVPEEIRQYKALFDEGIITEEEFLRKKQQLLGLDL